MIAFENYRLAEGRPRTEATMERLIVRKGDCDRSFPGTETFC
jgi:hypothetical protein